MPGKGWTTDAPKQVGWYWLITPKSKPKIVPVRCDHNPWQESWFEYLLLDNPNAQMDWLSCRDEVEEGSLWWGPLELPSGA